MATFAEQEAEYLTGQMGGERLGPGFGPSWIRLTPTHVVSWGLGTD